MQYSGEGPLWLMPSTQAPYAGITVYFPAGYTEEHVERLKAQFPGITGVLGHRCFSMDMDDDCAPLDHLRTVFAWIEKHLTANEIP